MDTKTKKTLIWIFSMCGPIIDFVWFWIIGVAFMDYGICWRTILAVSVIVALRFVTRVLRKMRKALNKLDQNDGSSVVETS